MFVRGHVGRASPPCSCRVIGFLEVEATRIFEPDPRRQTATNVVIDGLHVHALANSRNISKKGYWWVEVHRREGTSEVQSSSDLLTQTVSATKGHCLEGLLVESGRWLAGGHGELVGSKDRGETWRSVTKLPVAEAIHSVVRHDGRLWVASPFGAVARQEADGTWTKLPALRRNVKKRVGYDASRPYPEVGVARLKVIGGQLYVIGHGLWRWNGEILEQELESTTLLVDLEQTAEGTLLVGGIKGRFYRRESPGAWTLQPGPSTLGVVAIVALDSGILRVGKRGGDAFAWSTDDGTSFESIAIDGIDEKTYRFHHATADGHGGVLVFGFHGLLYRISTDGLGPWGAKREGWTPTRARTPTSAVATPKEAAAEEAALIAGVQAAIDDDAPRLVYADWLLERADPRGELIHVQCLLHRNESLTPPPAESKALLDREAALLDSHGDTWLAPILAYLRQWKWSRGFLDTVMSNATFLDGAPAIFARHPVTKLRLEGLKARDLDRLGRTALPGVRHLRLDTQRITGTSARALTSPTFSALEGLFLVGNPLLGDAGAKLLASESHLGQLKDLDVTACNITTVGAKALAHARSLASLETLRLKYNPIGALGLDALATSPTLGKLRKVVLCRKLAGYADVVGALSKRVNVVVED